MTTLLSTEVVSAPPQNLLFIPERLTPLAFTDVYRTLSEAQRVRYNQICGLYFLEQTIFFEQCMGRPVLERLMQDLPASLKDVTRQFIDEENVHTSWFRKLLRECEPLRYEEDCLRLVKAGPVSRAALGFCTFWPRIFPCLLWLQIIAEERAQYFSTAFLREAEGMDARFVEVQRQHLEDEGRHIRWDMDLIQWLWTMTPRYLRKWNARMLEGLLRTFFHLPKRSGWQVVEEWILEFPELGARRIELKNAMRSLADNPAFLRTLYPRSAFPRTLRLAASWPELDFLKSFFTD